MTTAVTFTKLYSALHRQNILMLNSICTMHVYHANKECAGERKNRLFSRQRASIIPEQTTLLSLLLVGSLIFILSLPRASSRATKTRRRSNGCLHLCTFMTDWRLLYVEPYVVSITSLNWWITSYTLLCHKDFWYLALFCDGEMGTAYYLLYIHTSK
jgi:hypothetical protein